MQSIISKIAFPQPYSSYDRTIPHLEFIFRSSDNILSSISSSFDDTIYAIPIRYYKISDDLPTILMCHGNNEDIGNTDPSAVAETFNVNICMFDYAGYGLHSCSIPSEKACQEDVIAVYEHLTKVKGVTLDKLIIYGRSLGSAIGCYLTNYLCQLNTPPKSLILVSPLMSAIRTVININIPFLDMFQNHLLAPNITCPVLILHGDDDRVVHYSSGLELSTLFPNLKRFVTLEGRGHCDIWTQTYYNEIFLFIRDT